MKTKLLPLVVISLFFVVSDCYSVTGYVAISGDIVSEAGASHGWVVFSSDDGTIVDICDNRSNVPLDAYIIEYDGYIFPGLIDTHDHTHWNTIPMWRPGRIFENRYQWQADQEYIDGAKSMYAEINDEGLWYKSLTYGEIRSLIGGTTMIQGSDGAEWGYLVRNLDYYGWLAYSIVQDVTTLTPLDIGELKWAYDNRYFGRIFLHVGEGKSNDPKSQAEFPFLEAAGLTLPGVVIIHGVALTQDDFEVMAQNDMYLVWSPKSNEVLYGETADIVGAIEAGVTVSLGADWSISGSDNLLEELKVAYKYSVEHLDGAITPKKLFQMVTSDAAKVAWADDPAWFMLGKLETGYQADLFLAPKYDDDPHVSLLKTYSKDIQLVFIDGKPLYGDKRHMESLVESEELFELVVSNKHKSIDIISPEFDLYHLDHFDELIRSFDILTWDIAPLVEDEPGSKPGFPRNLN